MVAAGVWLAACACPAPAHASEPDVTAGLRQAIAADGWSNVHCTASEYLIMCAAERDGLVAEVGVVRSGQMFAPSDAVDQAQRLEGPYGVMVLVGQRERSEAVLATVGRVDRLTAAKASRWLARAGLPKDCEDRDEGRISCRSGDGDLYVDFHRTPVDAPLPGEGPKRYARRVDGPWEVVLVISDGPASRKLLDALPPALAMVGDEGRALLDRSRPDR